MPRAVTPWTWRRMLRDHGPRDPSALLAAYTVGTYMDRDGFAHTSQTKLAKAARMDPKTFRKHIHNVESQGFIGIEKRRGQGQAWAMCIYRAAVPDNLALPDKDDALADRVCSEFGDIEPEGAGTSLPNLNGEGAGAMSPARHGERDEGAGIPQVKVREIGTEGAGNLAKVREHGFPTNSQLLSLSENSRKREAPAEAGVRSPNGVSEKTKEPRGPKVYRDAPTTEELEAREAAREQKRLEALIKLLREGFDTDACIRATRTLDTTVQHVEQARAWRQANEF